MGNENARSPEVKVEDLGNFIPLGNAARHWPGCRDGQATHVSRLIRFAKKGVPMPDGSRNRLRVMKFGKQWVTTSEWIREFGERQAAAEIGVEDGTPRPRQAATRARQSDRAGAELDKLGI